MICDGCRKTVATLKDGYCPECRKVIARFLRSARGTEGSEPPPDALDGLSEHGASVLLDFMVSDLKLRGVGDDQPC